MYRLGFNTTLLERESNYSLFYNISIFFYLAIILQFAYNYNLLSYNFIKIPSFILIHLSQKIVTILWEFF